MTKQLSSKIKDLLPNKYHFFHKMHVKSNFMNALNSFYIKFLDLNLSNLVLFLLQS